MNNGQSNANRRSAYGEHSSPFLKACRRKPTPYTPIWLMRQAGRYQKEYRALRKKYSFIEMCKTPELAAKVTLLPVEQFKVDAAIIFADILLPLEPMGVGFTFSKKEGPVFPHPVREVNQVEELRVIEPEEELSYLMEAIRIVRRELEGKTPLIGFAGAPFTLASYLIEGGHSKDYVLTKGVMYQNPRMWHSLMEKITEVLIRYLNAQVRAGAEALQLFDSWVGQLSPDDYRTHVLPYSRRAIEIARAGGAPIIHFGVNTAGMLPLLREAGGDVIGVDWRTPLDDAWQRIGFKKAVQGNLEPAALLGSKEHLRAAAEDVLRRAGNRNGHVFNLGHGVFPGTPVDNVAMLVDLVHAESRRP